MFIAHVGYEVTADVARRLVDGVDPKIVEQSCAASLSVEGVTAAFTKARWSGRRLTIEAVVTLDSDTPLGDATHTCHLVEVAILGTVPEARTVHVTPRCD